MFLGLLAYDWLRILIWFDHMGLRVASLVNLSFLGGDRADEAAARFIGQRGRTRAIPDGIRRFGTWAPLLIPFYIPRGAEWDQAWTGAETLARGGAPMPGAGADARLRLCRGDRGLRRGALAAVAQGRAKGGPPAPWLAGAPRELARRPEKFVFNNGAVGVEILRDGRGAAFVMGAERGGGPIDFFRRPLDPLQARGHFFYLSEDGAEPWSIGFEPARRAGDYRIEEPGFNRLAIVHTLNGVEARMEIGAGPRADRGARAGASGSATSPAGPPIAADELLRDRRPRDRGLRARSRFRRHACRDDVRPRRSTRSSPATGCCARRARTAARRRSSPSSPGAGAELVGYEDSRTRFLGEGSLTRPTGCERWRWRKLDDEGKLWTFDPAASFTLEIDASAQWRGRG